ncbi:MAG: hypothetical protein KGY41_07345 [Desulfovermiculus sp.]|nr:hypothetical protein [Desulfovermiculus sp.]
MHNDHLAYLLAGKAECEHLVVGITNPDPGLTARDDSDPEHSNPRANPMTFYQRLLRIENQGPVGAKPTE